MNAIIARAASGCLDEVSNATLDGHGVFRSQAAARHSPFRDADHDVGLLKADLEVAARQVVGDGTAARELRPGLQLLGEAELRDPSAVCVPLQPRE